MICTIKLTPIDLTFTKGTEVYKNAKRKQNEVYKSAKRKQNKVEDRVMENNQAE